MKHRDIGTTGTTNLNWKAPLAARHRGVALRFGRFGALWQAVAGHVRPGWISRRAGRRRTARGDDSSKTRPVTVTNRSPQERALHAPASEARSAQLIATE